MEAFEPKAFEYPIKKPSFDSVVRQKRREQAQKAEQERYAVIDADPKKKTIQNRCIRRWNKNDG